MTDAPAHRRCRHVIRSSRASPTVAGTFAIFFKVSDLNAMSAPRLEPPVAQVERLFQGWPPEGCDRVALLLQGGGALRVYQAGVYHYWDGGPGRARRSSMCSIWRIASTRWCSRLTCAVQAGATATAELLDIVWSYFTRSGSNRLSTASGLA